MDLFNCKDLKIKTETALTLKKNQSSKAVIRLKKTLLTVMVAVLNAWACM